jgi:predicted dehydrogenase
MADVRVAVVGAGANTRLRHLPNLRALDGVQVVGVCNRSRASAEAVAQEFDIPRVYEDWRDAVTDPGADAVVIGTWPNTHRLLAVAALEADKHVLCESRMAATAHEAREMLRAAELRPHLVAQLVPAPATLRVDQTVRRLLAEGYVGEVLSVDVRVAGSFVNRSAPLHWRQDIDLAGVNIMLLGVWYECIARWIGDAASVAAMGKTTVRTRLDASGRMRAVGVPDHVDVIADMMCGAQAHFQVTAVSGHVGSEAWVFGSEATLRFAGGQLFAGTRDDDALRPVEIPPNEEGGWRVEEEFIGAINGDGVVVLTTFGDGVKNMDFNEAVLRSVLTGRTVAVPFQP